MRQRSQPLNGSLIRVLRERLCLTIAEASDSAGYSTRAWQKFEAGDPAFRSTIRAIAKVLQVEPEAIVADVTYGLSSDLQAFRTTGLGSAVLTVNKAHLKRSATEVLYGLAVAFDALGDFDSAFAIAQALCTIAHDETQRAAAIIRLASIDDHRRRRASGLSRLSALRKRLESQKPFNSDVYYWACYQTGVLLVTSHRFAEAAVMLRRVEKGAASEDQKTSARHQLGVIALSKGRYREAERLFRACLLCRPPGSFRRAFEYRRIAEACALDGRKVEATDALKSALQSARRSKLIRYEREIAKVALKFGLPLE